MKYDASYIQICQINILLETGNQKFSDSFYYYNYVCLVGRRAIVHEVQSHTDTRANTEGVSVSGALTPAAAAATSNTIFLHSTTTTITLHLRNNKE